MMSWMAAALIIGVLNLLGSQWRDGDPVMQINGGFFLLLGLGLILHWHYKMRKEQDRKNEELRQEMLDQIERLEIAQLAEQNNRLALRLVALEKRVSTK